MAVTARNAGCLVFRRFFPAEMEPVSASNPSAIWLLCSVERALRVPNQVKLTRTAAVVIRNDWAGSWRAGAVVMASPVSWVVVIVVSAVVIIAVAPAWRGY